MSWQPILHGQRWEKYPSYKALVLLNGLKYYNIVFFSPPYRDITFILSLVLQSGMYYNIGVVFSPLILRYILFHKEEGYSYGWRWYISLSTLSDGPQSTAGSSRYFNLYKEPKYSILPVPWNINMILALIVYASNNRRCWDTQQS